MKKSVSLYKLQRPLFLFIVMLLLGQQTLQSQFAEKYVLSFNGGPALPITSGNLNDYFKFDIGGTMSLNYCHKKWAYCLSISGVDGKLKHDIFLEDGNAWKEGNKASFFSYGLSVGYSIYENIKFDITPFAGLVLSESRPPTSDLKEFPYLKEFDVNPILSPALGVSMTYLFFNRSNIREVGTYSSFGINAKINYIPFAVRGTKIPYKGDICYFSIGLVMGIFSVY